MNVSKDAVFKPCWLKGIRELIVVAIVVVDGAFAARSFSNDTKLLLVGSHVQQVRGLFLTPYQHVRRSYSQWHLLGILTPGR